MRTGTSTSTTPRIAIQNAAQAQGLPGSARLSEVTATK